MAWADKKADEKPSACDCTFCDCESCQSTQHGGPSKCILRVTSTLDHLSRGKKMYVEIRRKHLKENPTVSTMKGLKIKLKWSPKGKGDKKTSGKKDGDKQLMAMLTLEQVSSIIGEDVTKSSEFLELLRDNELDSGDVTGLFMLGEHESPDGGTGADDLVLDFKDHPVADNIVETKEAKDTRLVGAALAAGRAELLAEQARVASLEHELQQQLRMRI